MSRKMKDNWRQHFHCILLYLLSPSLAFYAPVYYATASLRYTDMIVNWSTRKSSLVLTMSSSQIAGQVSSGLERMIDNGDSVQRILKCWRDFSAGKTIRTYIGGNKEIEQHADCFVEGLHAMPFHDIQQDIRLHWALRLEEHTTEIRDELRRYLSRIEASKLNETPWLPPRDASGTAYGPQWKTLGLQDRSVWDEQARVNFPRTLFLLEHCLVPSCEVFFAKQGANSGILPHSDKNNFIITCHIPLDVPEGKCWIRVGDSTHYWQNAKAVVFDTSIIHSTRNDADIDRYVLLIRFWHPDLTSVEIKAFK